MTTDKPLDCIDPANDLATVALEFARECLGWDQVSIFQHWNKDKGESPPEIGCPDQYGGKRMSYTDLNAVMEAVRGWSEQNKVALFMQASPDTREVGVGISRYCNNLALQVSVNPCQALMAACVEASRKMKA